MANRRLREWKKGDKFSASHLNESLGITRPLARISVGGRTQFFQTPMGTTLYVPESWDFLDQRMGIITATGPTDPKDPAKNIKDWTDERYWVQFALPGAGAFSWDPLVFKPAPPPKDDAGAYQEPYPVCAINVPEIASHSHYLPADDTRIVSIFAFQDRDQNIHWLMNETLVDGVPFMVDLTQTGGSAGDASTLCSFVYTVKRIGSTITIGTGMSPEYSGARLFKMTATAATRGQAYYHAGSLILTIAYEFAAGNKPCTTA